jgi:triacylglycerol lipase
VVSDGLVPVESAKWGRFRGCVAADHLSEVGQPVGLTAGFDHLAFFGAIAAFLVAEGR